MLRNLLVGLAVAPLFASAVLASAPMVGTYVGTDEGDISKNLGALGFDVVQMGEDGDIIEAEIRDSSDIYDLEINPETGMIEHVEIDLDDDGDA